MFARYHWKIPALILGGMAAGLVCGLLGAGGGIVTVFVLESLWDGRGKASKDIFSAAVAVMLPICAFSAFLYGSCNALPVKEALSYAPPAILGGLFGGWLLDKLNTIFLRILFSGLVLYSGILMAFGR